MFHPLRQSTASQEFPLGPFMNSTDGSTAETGLTINASDIKLWKTGGTTEVNKNSGGATHMNAGRYYGTFDATDSNTLGPMDVNVHVSGALPVKNRFTVLPPETYDWLVLGSGSPPATSAAVAAAVGALSTVGGADNTIAGQLRNEDATLRAGSTTSLVVLAANAPAVDLSSPPQAFVFTDGALAGRAFRFTGYHVAARSGTVHPTLDSAPASGVGYRALGPASTTLDAYGLDAVPVESGVNARQALSPILAASAGVLAGAGTGTVTIKGGNVSTTRITAVVDSGNRTSVTLNLPA